MGNHNLHIEQEETTQCNMDINTNIIPGFKLPMVDCFLKNSKHKSFPSPKDLILDENVLK